MPRQGERSRRCGWHTGQAVPTGESSSWKEPWALSLPDKELCLREALAVCTAPAPEPSPCNPSGLPGGAAGRSGDHRRRSQPLARAEERILELAATSFSRGSSQSRD